MSYLEVEHRADRIIWRLARPERGNGLGTTLAAELLKACDALRDVSARVLVLTAVPLVKDGRATWIAGGDLKELAKLADQDSAEEYAGMLGRVCAALSALAIPVIAAIDGAAIGGGAELALWCDERLMTARSSLEFKQLKVGLACGYGTTKRLCDLVGLAKAQNLVYRCMTLSAMDARNAGLCAEVVEGAQDLQASVDAAVARWQALSPRAIAAQKAMFWNAANGHPGTARLAELQLFRGAWGNPQHRAFLERFKG
jgi:enoyl-CoA hydratase/carnithine racemase